MAPATEPLPPVEATAPAPAQPPVGRIRFAALAIVAVGLGCAATWVLDRAQFERLPATYQGRPLSVTAGCSARIISLPVPAGGHVKAGDPLLVLADSVLEEQIAAQERKVSGLETQVSATKARADLDLQTQRRQIQQEMFETRLRSAQYFQQRFASQLEKAAWEELAEDTTPRFASRMLSEADWIASLRAEGPQLDELWLRALLKQGTAANAEEVAASQVQLCEERLKQLEASLLDLPQRLEASHGVAVTAARLEQARAELAALQKRQAELTVVAARDGVVGVYRRREGDRVSADETIVQIIDDSQRFVVLAIDSCRMADFERGTLVDLTFSNGLLGIGRVAEVEPQAAEASDGQSFPQLSVRIDPAGATWPAVPFGSGVEVRRKR